MEEGWSSWETYWLHEFPCMYVICNLAKDPYPAKEILTCYGTKHIFDGRHHCEILKSGVPVQLRLLEVTPETWQPPFTIKAELAADVARGQVHADCPDDPGLSMLKAGDVIRILYWPDDCIGRILMEQFGNPEGAENVRAAEEAVDATE